MIWVYSRCLPHCYLGYWNFQIIKNIKRKHLRGTNHEKVIYADKRVCFIHFVYFCIDRECRLINMDNSYCLFFIRNHRRSIGSLFPCFLSQIVVSLIMYFKYGIDIYVLSNLIFFGLAIIFSIMAAIANTIEDQAISMGLLPPHDKLFFMSCCQGQALAGGFASLDSYFTP